ncbi:5237_t:CDS:2 [Funneliformis geosporum]|uniref:13042_t:CDS:1 n=1 Tax=Funneliformis geosporum TaxID=1117311 RepID=A0A9W4SXB5_9GLOM|nr:13042_t:CDS:2 [Funneliformis geosporum]CAI2184847.1 5237_t:CDS:2 [Funneliformis geosporum]
MEVGGLENLTNDPTSQRIDYLIELFVIDVNYEFNLGVQIGNQKIIGGTFHDKFHLVDSYNHSHFSRERSTVVSVDLSSGVKRSG